VKTISIRDLRQRWPQAEAALQVEDEILITRDSKPVAKLVRVVAEDRKRKRWDRAAHLRWLKKIWGGKMMPCSDSAIGHARADRWDKESAWFTHDARPPTGPGRQRPGF
jgi:antitoxin (DNA-binding transcriptional repressor) of toxin-antitoxin stability system